MADEKKKDVAPEHAPVFVPFSLDRWQLKEYMNQEGHVTVPAGTTPAQLTDRNSWAHMARKFRRCSTVQVHWDDVSQFAMLYVLDCGNNWASMCIIMHTMLSAADVPPQSTDYDVQFNGPKDQWRVMRKADRVVMRAGFATEREANNWRDEHVRRLAA